MPFFFERFAVVVAYHAEHPEDLTGTEQELAIFDASLNGRYADLLGELLNELGLPNTSDVRSIVVLLAKLSNGAKPRTQLKQACAYYASTRPALPSTVVAVTDATPV